MSFDIVSNALNISVPPIVWIHVQPNTLNVSNLPFQHPYNNLLLLCHSLSTHCFFQSFYHFGVVWMCFLLLTTPSSFRNWFLQWPTAPKCVAKSCMQHKSCPTVRRKAVWYQHAQMGTQKWKNFSDFHFCELWEVRDSRTFLYFSSFIFSIIISPPKKEQDKVWQTVFKLKGFVKMWWNFLQKKIALSKNVRRFFSGKTRYLWRITIFKFWGGIIAKIIALFPCNLGVSYLPDFVDRGHQTSLIVPKKINCKGGFIIKELHTVSWHCSVIWCHKKAATFN